MHISNSRRKDLAMIQEIASIAVRPSTLSGLSEQMVVSHYEDHYGNTVRSLNDVRGELAALDAAAPPNRLGRLKRDELSLMGSVALHELYFANLGGFRRAGPNSGLGRPDWHEVPDDFAAEIAADFASADTWRGEFTALAQSLAGSAMAGIHAVYQGDGKSDDTAAIQEAVNEVAAMKLESGFRGVLLNHRRYAGWVRDLLECNQRNNPR
jgi:superoxide dismutase